MLYFDTLLLCFCGINPHITLGYQNFKTEKRWYLSLCCSDKSLKVNTWSLSICCIQRKINYFRIFHVELLAGNRIVHVELLAGNRIVHDELLAGNYQQAEDLYTGRERWNFFFKNLNFSLGFPKEYFQYCCYKSLRLRNTCVKDMLRYKTRHPGLTRARWSPFL